MALLNAPPINGALVDKAGIASRGFNNWLMQVFRGVTYCGSGVTADRPALSGLKPGDDYFDKSLGANGKPIWVNKTATGWIDATGAGV